MQIVVEIPDIVKTHCDDGGILQTIDIIKLKNAVAHGKPLDSVLDEIKTKIEKLEYLSIEDGSGGYDKYADRCDVLDIIDKYREGENDADSN